MPPKHIVKVSSATGSAFITAAPLRGSKNTAYKSSLVSASSQERGLAAEKRVIEHFQNYKLLKQRYRTPFAEVDLIFYAPNDTLLMVEVKSLASFDFLPNRIGWKQKNRLLRAHQYLLSKTQKKVELNWAFVSEDGEVLVIENVCG